MPAPPRPPWRWIRLCAALALGAWGVEPRAIFGSEAAAPDRGAPEHLRQLGEGLEPAPSLAPLAFTPCSGGLAGAFPCDKVNLHAFFPLSTFGAGSANDNWGWTDPVTGKEYALVGLDDGTAFVDISSPSSPVYLGKLPTHTFDSLWRDIKVYSDHAFIVSEAFNHGLQVFDLTLLRNVPSPPVLFSETAFYGGFGSAHNLAINQHSGFAYAVRTTTCFGGLHLVDIRSPLAPAFAGCYGDDGRTHDAQCVDYHGPDPNYAGAEICFNSNEDTVTLVDVSNKSAPVQIARLGYSGVSYTHQGWLTEDHRFFLVDDELDELNLGHNTRTRVFDVTDLDQPELIGFFDAPVGASDHNLYVKGRYVYQANYRSGLRILNLLDPPSASLQQAGFFDTFVASNGAGFDGAWNAYPFFDSGVVIVNSIGEGLFIVAPDLPPDFVGFTMASHPAQRGACTTQTASYPLELAKLGGYGGTQVSLSTGTLPAEVAAFFSANPIGLPGGADLELEVGSGAAPGTYAIEVTGVGNDGGATANDLALELLVANAPPAAPLLTEPHEGALDQPIVLHFHWDAAAGESYRIQVDDNPDFAAPEIDAGDLVRGHYINHKSPLAPARRWYWRVLPSSACGAGAPSAVSSFTTRVDYQVSEDQPFSFIPGTTDTGNHCSNCSTPVVLPFGVDFYGATVTSAWVTSNGNLFFSQPPALQRHPEPGANVCLPIASFGDVVLGYWDDLTTSGSGTGIFSATAGTAPNRVFVIEYRNLRRQSNSSVVGTWEILLYENQRRIALQFQSMADPGLSATSGIQKGGGELFFEYSCNAPLLTNGKRIDYVFAAPLARLVAGGGAGAASRVRRLL